MRRICILTPDPSYSENWAPMAEQFRMLFGPTLDFRPWTATGDLTGFDMILPLLAWGYQRDPALWYQTLDRWDTEHLPVANPCALLRWNTDKAYLFDLAAKGVQIVPTISSDALCAADIAKARQHFASSKLIIKPAISAGADGTYALGEEDAIPFDVLERVMLMQPMMPAIAEEGEYSLFYFGGTFSHAILKKPAPGDFRVQEQFGGRETAVLAPAPARRLAEAALSATPAPAAYARVDMVRDDRGQFCLMELELIEPALFLSFAEDDGAACAKMVAQSLPA